MDVGWWMSRPWLTPCSMQISRIGVYGPKAGDHLFYIGSAKRKDEDISFFALVRNLKPITKHILFKKYKVAGRCVLMLSNASEVGESLRGLYTQLEEEAYRGI